MKHTNTRTGTLLAPLLLLLIVVIGYVYYIDRRQIRTPLAFSAKNNTTQSANDFSASGSQRIQIAPLSHHSASALALDDGRLLVAWFAGSREGAGDVAIYTSHIGGPNDMTTPRVAVTRHALGRALKRHYAKLGNPVLARLTSEQLVMYVTVVSIGGWSVSSIAVLTSKDNGMTWQPQRELHTSPFFNISTLVKYAPHNSATKDNQKFVLLPAYHEGFAKFGQYLLLDQQWRTREVLRVGTTAIQPSSVVNNNSLTVVLRDANKTTTKRALKQWQITDTLWAQPQPSATTLPNPDAAVDIVALDSDTWLLAYNHSQDKRSNMTLAYSNDQGTHWHTFTMLENTPSFEFSYPHFVFSGTHLHLFYTYNRQAIKHHWWSVSQLMQNIATARNN